MFSRLLSPCSLAWMLAARVLAAGARAIDATAGRGNDTLFLARQVGAAGKVYAFDIQAAALAAARCKLTAAGLLDRVELIPAGHERMREYVKAPVQAVMFNLGYLPGGCPEIMTKPATTIRAMEKGLELLAAGGVMTVVAYPGHPGGRAETEAVAQYLLNLNRCRFALMHCQFPKIKADSAQIFVVEKGNCPECAELMDKDNRPDNIIKGQEVER